MDKNKSRTDLLAAGRKKLQQFRQKKDSKGSKSSGKSGKSERDAIADSTSAAAEPAEVSSQVSDGERSVPDSDAGTVGLLASDSMENELATEIANVDDIATVNHLSVSVSPETGVFETTLGTTAELSPEDLGASEAGLDSSRAVDLEDATVTSFETAETTTFEGKSTHAGTRVPVELPASPGLVDTSETAAVAVEVEGAHGEDQVTDVGTMQEADASGLKQVDRSSGIELEADKSLSLSGLGESVEALSHSGNTGMDDATNEIGQTREPNDVFASVNGSNEVEVHKADGLSDVVQPLAESDVSSAVIPEVAVEQREVLVSNSSKEEKPEMPSASCHYGGEHTERVQVDIEHNIADDEGTFVAEGDSFEKVLGSKMVILSSGTDLSSISLIQLAEVLQGLGEEELKFLLMSTEFSSAKLRNTGSLNAADSGFLDVLHRLKEKLYLTNFAKDIFHVQLSEQSELQMELDHQCHQLVDEISTSSASINAVRGEKESLTEELAQCKSELQAVVCESEEHQKQLHFAKTEIEEFSARVDELQIKLGSSQGDFSSLSSELADCRFLLGVLQVENEKLKGSLNLVAQERDKLVEEKGELVLENGKLLMELVECKASLASLRLENVNLSGDLALLTEERRKLDEEKEYFFHENDKLLTDSADCKLLLEALQMENANLNGILTSVGEEMKKLEEEKVDIVHDNEKLSMALRDCKDLVDGFQVTIANLNGSLTSVTEERNKLVDDLKGAILRLEQLTEENVFLSSSLDLHKATLSEFDNWRMNLSSQSEQAGSRIEGSDPGQEGVTNDDCSHQIPTKGESDSSFLVSDKSSSDCRDGRPPPTQLNLDVFDDSFGFVAVKRHLEEADNVIEKLEKAIEGMHFHSVSLSKSSGKMVAPGVSKLIQAFESKVHTDDHDLDELPSTENRSVADPYMLTKEQTGNLRAVLKELCLDSEIACELYKGERNSKTLADAAVAELKSQYEDLKEHGNNLEEANIEHVVLYEALRQHMCDIEAKKDELVAVYEALNQQDIILKAENSGLRETLNKFQTRINELQRQLDEMYVSSDEMVSSICNQVETLHKEVKERATVLEQEWDSTIAQVDQAVEKLDASIETLCSPTHSRGIYDGLDIVSRVTASVNAATKVIADLQEKIKAAHIDQEAICSSFNEVKEKFNNLHENNDIAVGMLHKIHGNIRKLVSASCGYVDESETGTQNEKLLDPLQHNNYDTLLEQLGIFLGERLHLESVNNKLNLEVMDRTKDLDEMNKRCIGADAILKLVEEVEHVVKLDGIEINSDEPAAGLESLISFLVQKCKKTDEQIIYSKKEFVSKEMELSGLQGQIDDLIFTVVQYENEILILKESLRRAEGDSVAVISEFQDKVIELEQSDQRVSSLREKLSIAVTKGKSLIVQRDSLKQSLAARSSEMEKCSQELQSKDARLHELETKLKTYSDSGERVESLESELSYIRNSATALRESFLLKDSVLQRIEEILEDLELPEHFHSRDIIEKIDWLARSVTGNTLPVTDWDQKSSVGGGSYSDAGFVVMDAWKDDAQPNSNSGDDLRIRYEDLQGKFYGLAEQNEMLEQSLIVRNNLVQRLEEILDRIDMPSQLRSMEMEDRIEWLGGTLSEIQSCRNALQQKIDNLETFCGSLTAGLEESQRRISDLDAALQLVLSQKENLSQTLETLTRDYDEVSEKASQLEAGNNMLQNEVRALQEKLDEKLGYEERIHHIEGWIRRLEDLVTDALQDPGTEDLAFDCNGTEYLERLVMKLIEKYTALSLEKPISGNAVDEHVTEKADATPYEERISDSGDGEDQDVLIMKKNLEEALSELMHVKEEREKYMENNQYLVREVEAIDIKRQELQDLLNQEEQKSASLREKLNVAVRKGKSLVQQRDSMKQTIEEANMEMERLKSERKLQENVLLEYEKKIKDLSRYQERVEVMESEKLSLINYLAETEYHLQEKEHLLSMILNTLGDIDVGFEFNGSDPVENLEQMEKLCRDLRASLTSSEHEVRKSKRAAELLLEELNEVQERNDGFQEELAKAASELSELSKERDLAEAAKHEALERLEKLSAVRSKERNNQFAEIMVLKSGVDQLREVIDAINNLLSDVLSKDLEFLHNLEAGMKSSLNSSVAHIVVGLPIGGSPGGLSSSSTESKGNFLSTVSLSASNIQEHFYEDSVTEFCSFVERHLQAFTTDIGSLKEKLYAHSFSVHEKANCISEVFGTLHKEMTYQKQSFESGKRDFIRLESIEKDKDKEMIVLRRNISLLYEACTSSVVEIENWKAHLVGNSLATEASVYGGNNSNGQTLLSSEEFVRTNADKLLSVVKDFISVQAKIVELGQKEMKTAISNLQKELLEKDGEKDKICMELVSQIKEAEAAARSYLQDLHPAKARIHDLERQVNVMEEERIILEQRVKDLQVQEATSVDLQERVKSLTETVAAKEQEIESLMQALDEEEAQMEDLTKKVGELERALQQKNLDLENLEAFRVKATKKLSVTVSKFDELHDFSVNLLSEVEKLQSLLKDRDAEISFLRQEVTRCTNDALVASQMSNNRNSNEIHDLLTWLNEMISRVQTHDVHFDDKKTDRVHEYKERFQKQIISFISELEDLRVLAHNKEKLLEVERRRVEELAQKGEFLENSLREKEARSNMFQDVGDFGQATTTASEIMEVDPVINKRTVPGTSIVPQVRSLRKTSNDQVAIAIDRDPSSVGELEYEDDDDKAHGFKSLTTSRIIPRFTRPVTDMIDGLWVSCDRALMRQPALRLSVIIYWAIMHFLFAMFIF